MSVQILYDNQTLEPRLHAGWGFSCLVNGRLLFDTGESGEKLLENMDTLGIDPATIKEIVLSHPHWDHSGGLALLRERIPRAPLYLPDGAIRSFPDQLDLSGALVHLCSGRKEVDGVATTGTFASRYKGKEMPEQGLVVRGERGISLITGCAHPGILTMAKAVAAEYPNDELYALIGGFHLKEKGENEIRRCFAALRGLGFKRIIATHCSGATARRLSDRHTGAGDLIPL